MVVYQPIWSGSMGSPIRSATTLWPVSRPIGRACWQDITARCESSTAASANRASLALAERTH
jgi:hypothetical protein